MVTMSQKSSVLQPAKSVSQPLTPDNVIAKVKVSETGGTIHYPTSVVLTPIDIQEESQ
jgi:hypothetical protein